MKYEKAIEKWLAACEEWHDSRNHMINYLYQRMRIEGGDPDYEIAVAKSIRRHDRKIEARA